MKLKEAKDIAGSLSNTSKMPGYSTGLPAWKCKRGSKLAKIPGSVCFKCYALKGMYRFPVVKAAQEKRLDGIRKPQWVEAMTTLISHYCRKEPFFRWFDSGDLQSVSHLRRIVKVCERTPQVAHWLATREKDIVDFFLTSGGQIPENLVIRVSADMVGQTRAITPVPGLVTSTVHTVEGEPTLGLECGAYKRGGECGRCRACWSPKVSNVSYLEH